MNKVPEFVSLMPNEANGYSFFERHFEEDEEVFFHVTLARNLYSIINNGFRSSASLTGKGLGSVSYAKKSFSCYAHLNNKVAEDYVIFAVRFKNIDRNEIEVCSSDIKVHSDLIQPEIICFCRLQPK